MKEEHPEAYIEQETIECKLCLMKYTKKSVYINHYQENHGSVPPEYKNEDLFICELCSKCFPAVGTLRQHINAVHKKTSKEFKNTKKRDEYVDSIQCSSCNETFSFENTYIRYGNTSYGVSSPGIQNYICLKINMSKEND